MAAWCVNVAVAVVAGLAVAGCNSSNGGGNPAAGGGPGVNRLFNLPHGDPIQMSETSVSYNKGTDTLTPVAQDYFFKAREQDTMRVLRYGKPHAGFNGRKHYEIPITLTNSGGVTIGTGTATFTGIENQSGVASRTFNVSDIRLSDSIFGLFSTEDTGTRGDFFEIHAYAGGVAATNLPASATYMGTFLGDVISGDYGTTGTTQRVQLPTDLTVDFTGGSFTGNIGASGSPDLTMAGTISGTSITGTATVASGGVVLAPGQSGAITGGFFGDGANNMAGSLGITDTSGTVRHELVGAFGATKQ